LRAKEEPEIEEALLGSTTHRVIQQCSSPDLAVRL
jgi:nucleotide-binding universal stress UspA family protein